MSLLAVSRQQNDNIGAFLVNETVGAKEQGE